MDLNPKSHINFFYFFSRNMKNENFAQFNVEAYYKLK